MFGSFLRDQGAENNSFGKHMTRSFRILRRTNISMNVNRKHHKIISRTDPAMFRRMFRRVMQLHWAPRTDLHCGACIPREQAHPREHCEPGRFRAGRTASTEGSGGSRGSEGADGHRPGRRFMQLRDLFVEMRDLSTWVERESGRSFRENQLRVHSCLPTHTLHVCLH